MDYRDVYKRQEHLLLGKTAHDQSGEVITGTCSYDADTGDATAAASDLLAGKTAYVDGAKVTGTMADKGAVTGTIATKEDVYKRQPRCPCFP